jgi:hypothetical protein
MHRRDTTPGIVEFPTSPTDLDGGGNELSSDSTALVTMPDLGEEGQNGSLTSPNLVHNIDPGMSLASATSYAKRQSSSVRKQSSSSVSTMRSSAIGQAGMEASQAVVSSVSASAQSASSASASSHTASIGAIGQDGQAVMMTGTKMSSAKSQESSSSMSARQITGANGSESVVASSSSSHRQSSSSQKSSCITMTSAAGSGSLTRSLLTSSQIDQCLNTIIPIEDLTHQLLHFDNLESLTPETNSRMVESALLKESSILANTIAIMKRDGRDPESVAKWIDHVNNKMIRAWSVPAYGHEIGNTLCDILRKSGGLDILIDNCVAEHKELQFQSAKLLQQCLVTANRGYVVEKGLDKVLSVAKEFTDTNGVNSSGGPPTVTIEKVRVGTGILEHLFKHSETTCSDVIAMGGLDRVVNVCKSTDTEALRHCASALANVAIFGGNENQEAMIQRKVPSWLFPLAFSMDIIIKYYACLAIAVLVSNKEIEAAVQKSGALELIEPFVQTHTPAELSEITATHSHGQSSSWLKRLIPVLLSNREEARNLAAFHFCMEAEIKKQQGKPELLQEVGCVESLRKVASGPNGIASKYAAQTLRLINEEVPHKLSQQVPTWSVPDVKEWIKQIGFPQYADSFEESRVDGDLLLQLSEDMLREDIEMRNGILRRRFMRELTNLKRMADYSSCDSTNLNGFLQSLGNEYCVYTYEMLNAGIDRDTLMSINEEQLLQECGIKNKVHRIKIGRGVKVERGEFSSITDEGSYIDKTLDVFISYRRSNGSQLASLLKVHLEIRNLSIFLDVDRLEAGKFDNNLLQSIRSARNFVLVLTPGALDRCMGDVEQRDWIHKEVACALSSKCNIIPVIDNFVMPDPDQLPVTMNAVTSYNGVKWIHDYQDACVDKIDRFIRGDNAVTICGMMDRFLSGASSISGASSVTPSYNRQNTYQRTISTDSTKAPSGTASCSSDSETTAPNSNVMND